MKYCIKTLGMYIRGAYAKENVRPEGASFGTFFFLEKGNTPASASIDAYDLFITLKKIIHSIQSLQKHLMHHITSQQR
jgi:hypothetical protein